MKNVNPSSARYDDDQLLELVREHSPEELTVDQIDVLRQGIRTNPDLREALIEELSTEQALASHYSPQPGNVTKVADRIEQLATSRRRERVWRLYGIAVCLVLVVAALTTAGYWMSQNPDLGDSLALLTGSKSPEPSHDQPSGVPGAGLNFRNSLGDSRIAAAGRHALNASDQQRANARSATQSPQAASANAASNQAGPQGSGEESHGESETNGRTSKPAVKRGQPPHADPNANHRDDHADVDVDAQTDEVASAEVSANADQLVDAQAKARNPTSVFGFSLKRQRPDLDSSANPSSVRSPSSGEAKPGNQANDRPARSSRPAQLVDLDWRWYLDPLINKKQRQRLLSASDLLKPLDDAKLDQQDKDDHPDYFKLDGWYQLTEPLGRNWNLRLALDRFKKDSAIDLWHGKTGVRFALGDNYWRGYRLHRDKTDQHKPDLVQLAVRGTGTSQRFRDGTFDLSYENSHVILSRGGVVIAALPLAHAPDQSYLHGKAELYLAQLRPAAKMTLPAFASGSPPKAHSNKPSTREPSSVSWQASGNERWVIDQPGPGSVVIRQRSGDMTDQHGSKNTDKADGKDSGKAEDKDNDDDNEKPTKDKGTGPFIARMPLPPTPGYDVIFKVEKLPLGSEFFVQQKGHDPQVLGSIKMVDGHRMLLDPDSGNQEKDAKNKHAAVGRRFWIRIMGGYSRVVLLGGLDGRSWYVSETQSYQDAPIDSHPDFVGIRLPHPLESKDANSKDGKAEHAKDDQAKADPSSDGDSAQTARPASVEVRLDDLQLYTHHALTDLAPAKLVRHLTNPRVKANDKDKKLVKELNEADSLGEFRSVAERLRPESVDGEKWNLAKDAAAVDQLAGHRAEVCKAVAGVLSRAITTGQPTDKILAAFREATTRYAVGYSELTPRALREDFNRLARREFKLGHTTELVKIMDTWCGLRILDADDLFDGKSVQPRDVTRLMFYALLADDQWPTIREQALRVRYLAARVGERERFDWEDRDNTRLSRWMLAHARRWLGGEELSRYRLPRKWMHPLAPAGDRQTESAVAELLAAVDNQQYLQAARLLTARPFADQLVSVGDDPDLLRSSYFLIRSTIDQNPALKQILTKQFGNLGQIRVRRALETGDVKALQAAAIEFHGTAAGRAAIGALADRDLSMGRFFSAANRYDMLVHGAGSDHRVDRALRAKHRLAWAMIGELRGQPIHGPVTLDGRRYKPDDFEAMIQSLRVSHNSAAGEDQDHHDGHKNDKDDKHHHPNDADGDSASSNPPAQAFGPSDFKVNKLTKVSHQDHDDHHWNPEEVTLSLQGNLVEVNSKSKTAAYEIDSGDKAWLTQQRADGRHHFITHPAMANRRFFRYWFHDGGFIRGLDKDGKLAWQEKFDDGALADPLRVGNALYVLSKTDLPGGRWGLNLHRVELDTGQSIASKRLARVSDGDGRPVGRRLIFDGRRIVIHLPGIIICTDSVGQVQWVRRLTNIPEDADRDLWKHRREPILFAGQGSMIVHSPGSPSIQCLDVKTGDLRWQVTMPSARGLAFTTDKRVYVRTEYGLVCLNLKTAKRQWIHAGPAGHTRYVRGPSNAPLMVNLNPWEHQWTLSWLDPSTGDVTETRNTDAKEQRNNIGDIRIHDDALLMLGDFKDGHANLFKISPTK